MVHHYEWTLWYTRMLACSVVLAVIAIPLGYLLVGEERGSIIPFTFFYFFGDYRTWGSKTWEAFVSTAWIPIGLVFFHTTMISYFTKNKPEENAKAESLFLLGAQNSIFAGVLEEIGFRWIIFYGYVVIAVLLDHLSTSLLGVSVLKFVYDKVFWWPASMSTWGFIDTVEAKYGWAVAAAMLAANGLFRDGHAYNGLTGLIISWFMGMYFFWVMFTYGLVPAIIVHFVYDLIIYWVRYWDMYFERQAGNTTHTI